MTPVMNKQKKIDAYNFPYTFNPYTGCAFGCIYCYSIKSTIWSARLKRWGIKPYTAKPKPDVVKRLRADLKRYENIESKLKEVQIGNFYEPYPPVESKNEITRECLKVFAEHPEWKVHLETKSDLILRDIDVIQTIPKFEAEITITTLTHDKYFEPNAISTQERLKVIKKLSDNGIFVRTMIMPVLEGYTDIMEIKKKSTECGAQAHKQKGLNYFSIYRLEREAGLRK